MLGYESYMSDSLAQEKEHYLPVSKTEFKPVIIDGINLTKWIPDYYLHSSYVSPNHTTTYYLRSNSGHSIFIHTLYVAMYETMLQMGYEPNEEFEYVSINSRKTKREAIYRHQFFKRLGIWDRVVHFDRIHAGIAKILYARFFDNDPMLNYGFSVEISCRTFMLRLRPHVPLLDLNGKPLTPVEFVKQFFQTINYPYYLYHFQVENKTISRLIAEDYKVQHQIGKFQRNVFPL